MNNYVEIDTLIKQDAAAAEEERKAAFAKAKGNVEKLMVLGVICTPDDEEESAWMWERAALRAMRERITFSEAEELCALDDARAAMVRTLQRAVKCRETEQEFQSRLKAAQKTVPFGVNPETGKKCRVHKWVNPYGGFNMHAEAPDGCIHIQCVKCQGTTSIPHCPDAASPGAVEAARILQAAGF